MNINDYCVNDNGVARLKNPIQGYIHGDIVTANPEVLKQLQLLERTACTTAPIMIEGELGIGKEMYAQYVHAHSNRANRQYTSFNCATVPKDRCETELFGTGQSFFGGRKDGLLNLTDGGTFFFKDINQLSKDIQNKLLEAVDGGIVSKNSAAYDVRIVASYTEEMQDKRLFFGMTEELYYYLNIIKIRLLPLRERREDIILLAFYFLEQMVRGYSMHHAFSWEVLSAMVEMDWPNNIRQLKNAVERMVWLSDQEIIGDVNLLYECAKIPRQMQAEPSATEQVAWLAGADRSLKEIVSEYEIFVIKEYVERYGSLRKAAQVLKVSPASLSRKLNT